MPASPAASPLSHDEVLITQVIVFDPTWPSDLILDLEKSNWHVWNHQIRLLADKFGAQGWLMGTLPCPDATVAQKTVPMFGHFSVLC
jgi:hypothetical protein